MCSFMCFRSIKLTLNGPCKIMANVANLVFTTHHSKDHNFYTWPSIGTANVYKNNLCVQTYPTSSTNNFHVSIHCLGVSKLVERCPDLSRNLQIMQIKHGMIHSKTFLHRGKLWFWPLECCCCALFTFSAISFFFFFKSYNFLTQPVFYSYRSHRIFHWVCFQHSILQLPYKSNDDWIDVDHGDRKLDKQDQPLAVHHITKWENSKNNFHSAKY